MEFDRQAEPLGQQYVKLSRKACRIDNKRLFLLRKSRRRLCDWRVNRLDRRTNHILVTRLFPYYERTIASALKRGHVPFSTAAEQTAALQKMLVLLQMLVVDRSDLKSFAEILWCATKHTCDLRSADVELLHEKFHLCSLLGRMTNHISLGVLYRSYVMKVTSEGDDGNADLLVHCEHFAKELIALGSGIVELTDGVLSQDKLRTQLPGNVVGNWLAGRKQV